MLSNQIRIVHFVEELGLGCTAKTAVNFCVGLKKMDCNIELWSLKTGIRAKELIANDIVVRYFSLAELIKEQKFGIDIFHFHSSGLSNSWTLNLLKSFSQNTKIVQTNIFGGYCASTHKFIDLKLFVSEATLFKYYLHGGRVDKNFNVLYNPVQNSNIEFDFYSNTKSGKLIIGRIARPDLSKWEFELELLLKYLKDTKFDFKLKIVGVPEEIKKNLMALNIDIEFIDKIENNSKLHEFYSSIDVLLHLSSIGESFGCVFVEAMNFGVPVVVKSTPLSRIRFWNDNAQVEIVQNGKTGFVCDNILSMIDALMLLERNRFKRENIIEINQKIFDKESIIMKLFDFYMQILQNQTVNLDISKIKSAHKMREKGLFKSPILSQYHLFRYQLTLAKITIAKYLWKFNL